MNWFKNFRKRQLTVKDVNKATARWKELEDEVNELEKFSELLCPVIGAKVYYNDTVDTTNNPVLSIAINERISKLRKLQEDITV